MKRLIICIFFITVATVCWGQMDIDSLRFLSANYQTRDTVRVNILTRLGYEYWIVDPSQSEEFGLEALEIASELNYIEGQAFANRVVGVAHWARGNYERALEYLYASLTLYEDLEDAVGQGNALMNIGLVFSDRLDSETSLRYFNQAISLFEETGKLDRLATTFTKVGSIYLKEGEFDKAYEYLIKALQIHQQNQFDYGIAETNNRLGKLFYLQDDVDRAKTYLHRAFSQSSAINDREGMTNNLQDLGMLYQQTGNSDSAKFYFSRALDIGMQIGSLKRMRDAYLGLKEVYQVQGEYQKALDYANSYEKLKDSVFNEEMSNRIAHLQTEIEVLDKNRTLELQRAQITSLEKESELTRIILWILGFLVVALAIIVWLTIKYQRQKIKLAREKQHTLKNQLEFQNKELASYTMNFIQKNEFLEELKGKVGDLQTESSPEIRHKLAGIGRMIDNAETIDRDWERFRIHFEKVHEGYLDHLRQRFPELSGSDLKLCALIRLNLSMKESSALLGISTDSVKTARYRLRKKLNLDSGENLYDFLACSMP
jgi:tetratricopeptide (TPR) repeat protein